MISFCVSHVELLGVLPERDTQSKSCYRDILCVTATKLSKTFIEVNF
jgi:hypothetical protein